MGATIRMTKDRRILIRNTAELKNPNKMSDLELKKRSIFHKIGIQKRFPTLPKNIINSSIKNDKILLKIFLAIYFL